MPTSNREARDAGRQALLSLRRTVAERVVAAMERRDPDLLSALSEVGVVRRAWVEDPAAGGPMSAPPVDVIQRLLERSVERQPSLLASLGLSAIQLLASPKTDDRSKDAGVTERLAVAFTDLEQFTRWTAKNGDDAASALLAEHHKVVGPVVRSRGGRIVKRLGDGLLLTFPEAEAAVLACLEMVDGLPGPLRLRAGINLGPVVVTRDDVIGHEVNVAARVTEAARAGEVLVTAPVRQATASSLLHVTFGRQRRRSFKGLSEAIGVSRVSRDEPRRGDGTR
jgi:adenylate cyclase